MNKQSFQVPDLKTVDTVEARNLRLQNLDKLIDQSVGPVYKLNATFTFKAGWFRTKAIEYKIDYGHPIVSNLSKILLDDIRFKKIDAGDFDIWSTDICRKLTFKNVGWTSKHGIKLMKYSLSENVFDNGTKCKVSSTL